MASRLVFAALFTFCFAFSTSAQTEENDENPLSVLNDFVGTTWKGDVTPDGSINKVYDITRWEWTLGGQAIRIQHGLDDGSYAGEALVVWDGRAKTMSYIYATSAGFFTRGSMRADAEFYDALETVVGGPAGIVAVKTTGELLKDGTLQVVSASRSRQGWTEPDTTIYYPSPDTDLVFDNNSSK